MYYSVIELSKLEFAYLFILGKKIQKILCKGFFFHLDGSNLIFMYMLYFGNLNNLISHNIS